MSKNKRQPKMLAVVGTNGTGKTWFTKYDLIPKIGRRVLVIDSDNREPEWYKYESIDIAKRSECKEHEFAYTCYDWYASEGKAKFWEYIYRNVDDCVLVLDDCRDFVPNDITSIQNLRNTFSRRRQKMLDIIIIQHSVSDIPLGLIRYLNGIVLFNSTDSSQQIASRLEAKSIEPAVREIRERAKTNPHYKKVIPLQNLR